MYHKKLEYMLSDNVDVTISKKGSDIRKKIRPMFINFLKLGNKLKLVVEKNEYKKIDRPIIYAACHAFKDDVLNTILTSKDDSYIVFGNIDLFYNTFDGLCLWIYGTQLVDRYNKDSKHAMKEKMNKIIEYGNNILIFPEATWNLSENMLMLPLYWGFYDVAKKNNALIVPIVTYKVGKTCYSRQMSPIDINNILGCDVECALKLMKKYYNKAVDLIMYDDNESIRVLDLIKELKYYINEYEVDPSNFNYENISICAKYCSNAVKDIIPSINDKIESETYMLVSILLSRIGTSLKEAQVARIRDIMATEKYDLYEKHPDNSYMVDNKDMYEAWEDYVNDTVKGTPYFYKEEEATTIFKDPLVQNIDEVMPWLSNNQLIKRR